MCLALDAGNPCYVTAFLNCYMGCDQSLVVGLVSGSLVSLTTAGCDQLLAVGPLS